MVGRSIAPYSHAKDVDDGLDAVWRTCPEFFARQHAILELYGHLADYKRGSLGDVRHLPAPLWVGLRLLDTETDAMVSALEAEALED